MGLMTESKTTPMQMAALRSCLSGPLGLSEVLRGLSDDHFDDDRMLGVFTAIREMYLLGYQIAPEPLATYLDVEKGVADAQEVVASVWAAPETANPTFVIRALTTMRGRQMLVDLGDFLKSPDAISGGMEKALARVNQFTLAFSSMSTERVQTLAEFMADIEKPGDKPLILLPGLGELDDHYRLRPGLIHLVGAAPGSGKTALLLQMAMNIAEQGHDVLTISLELPSFDLMARATAMKTGVSAFRASEKTLEGAEIEHVKYIARTENEAISRFHHITPSKMQVDAIHPEINKWIATKNIKAVAVDYVQRLQAPPKFNSREYERVTYVSETLTAVAKSVGIPIIAASATRRKNADEKGGDPNMHDLRSSGQLEFDAATILMLSRDKDNKNLMHADLVKNRYGGLMGTDLFFDFSTQRIRPV